MKPSDLRVHIRQLCCLGVGGEQLMPALLKAVRTLVGGDSAKTASERSSTAATMPCPSSTTAVT
ncbi:MAG TPA: hypothetical protein VMN56_18255 [Casimicrobiaceae bacterium]|nr:hypothetical protein [Casimicrobiaceae bacterium]